MPTVVEVMVKVYRPGPEGGKANLIVRVRAVLPRSRPSPEECAEGRKAGRKAGHGSEEPVGKPVKKPGTGRKAGPKALRKAGPRLA